MRGIGTLREVLPSLALLEGSTALRLEEMLGEASSSSPLEMASRALTPDVGDGGVWRIDPLGTLDPRLTVLDGRREKLSSESLDDVVLLNSSSVLANFCAYLIIVLNFVLVKCSYITNTHISRINITSDLLNIQSFKSCNTGHVQ